MERTGEACSAGRWRAGLLLCRGPLVARVRLAAGLDAALRMLLCSPPCTPAPLLSNLQVSCVSQPVVCTPARVQLAGWWIEGRLSDWLSQPELLICRAQDKPRVLLRNRMLPEESSMPHSCGFLTQNA